MTDYSDLIERLSSFTTQADNRKAAAVIEAQAARIAELEAVLEANDKIVLDYCSRITKLEAALLPFAEFGDVDVSSGEEDLEWGISGKMLRAALAALEGDASVCPICGGDCAGANPPVIDCPQRAALEHKE